MKANIHKARYLLATHRRTILSVCVLLLVLSVLGAAYTFANPPSTTVTDVTNESSVTSSVSTEATVDRDSALYTEGETLRNEPLYFYGTTPEVEFVVSTDAPSERNITGTQTLSLRYQARTRDGEQFWTDERTIGRADVGGEQTTHRASLHMGDVRDRFEDIESETGGDVRVSVQITLSVAYQLGGENGTVAESRAVTFGQNSYSIPSFTGTTTHRETERRSRPVPSKVTAVALPGDGDVLVPHRTMWLLLLTGIATLVGAATVATRDVDPELEKTAIQRARYQEWISPGRVPTDVGYVVLTVESLEELVNVAIDSDKRVVYDRTQRCYVVVDGVTMYVYLEQSRERERTTEQRSEPNERSPDE